MEQRPAVLNTRKEVCAQCKYVEPTTNSCHRFPPNTMLVAVNEEGAPLTMSSFPRIKLTDHCGEFMVKLNIIN